MVAGKGRRMQLDVPFVLDCCCVIVVTSATISKTDNRRLGSGVAVNWHSDASSRT